MTAFPLFPSVSAENAASGSEEWLGGTLTKRDAGIFGMLLPFTGEAKRAAGTQAGDLLRRTRTHPGPVAAPRSPRIGPKGRNLGSEVGRAESVEPETQT